MRHGLSSDRGAACVAQIFFTFYEVWTKLASRLAAGKGYVSGRTRLRQLNLTEEKTAG